MKNQEVSVAPGEVSGRMVLGRMVLGIEESGRVVSERMISEGRVSAGGACPPAAIDQNPHGGIHAIHERSLHYGEASGTVPFQGRANSDQSHLQGNVAPDANPFHTGDGSEGFYLSKSRLNRYISCPRSYFIHYELGIAPLRPDTDRLIGLSTHRLIAAHHLARKKDEFVDPNVMLDDFWSRHAREGDDAAIHQEMKAARNDSLRYAELFIREAPLDPLEIERAFTVPLVNLDNGDTLPVPLVGVVDLVDQPNGIPRPLEIKTRARKADDCRSAWLWSSPATPTGSAGVHGLLARRAGRDPRRLHPHHQDQNPHDPVADGHPHRRGFHRTLPDRRGRP